MAFLALISIGFDAGEVYADSGGVSPTWLGAEAEAEYLWMSIPAGGVENAYQTHAWLFSESGVLDLRPNPEFGPFTDFEFSVCLVSAEDRLVMADGSAPPHWKPLHARGQAAAATVTAEIYDEQQDTGAQLVKRSLTEFYREYRFRAALPRVAEGARQAIFVNIDLADGVRALVYRVDPVKARKHPARVVLISLDTHALQHMSLHEPRSVDTNPSLRRLVREDPRTLSYSGARAVSNWTLPTHATILTGLYPSQHGLVDQRAKASLSREVFTLAQLLNRAGAATYHLASHTRVGFECGFHRGVDFYRQYEQPLGQRGRSVLSDALQLLTAEKGRSVFMFLHLFDSHFPYTNYPRDYRSYYRGKRPWSPKEVLYGDLYMQEIYRSGGWDPRARQRNIEVYREQIGDRMPAARAAYRLGLRDVDDMLGAFFEGLKNAGLFRDTTIILLADHGEEFFGHGLLTHTSLYDENLSIPFVIKLAASGGSTIATPIERKVRPQVFEGHTTAYRAVLDLFAVAPPAYWLKAGTGGLDLNTLLHDGSDTPAFSEMYMSPLAPYYEASLVVERGKKVIFSTNLTEDYTWQMDGVHTQMFDVRSDPANKHNLYDREDEECVALRDRVIRRAQEVRKARFEPTVRGDLSEEQLRRLRDLGYVN